MLLTKLPMLLKQPLVALRANKMPLIPGKSKKSFGKNVETEMDAGKPQKQALAIAYAMKRKGKKKMAEGGSMEKGVHQPYGDADLGKSKTPKERMGQSMAGDAARDKHQWANQEHRRVLEEGRKQKTGYFAEGGQITDNYQESCNESCVQPCSVHQSNRQEGGFQDHEGDVKRPSSEAMSEDERKLGQHGEHEEGRQGNEGHYSEGGGVHEASERSDEEDKEGESSAGAMNRLGAKELAKEEHRRILKELMEDRRDRKFMAEGGEVAPPKGTYRSDHTSEVNPGQMAGGIEENNLQEDQQDRHDQEGRPMAHGGEVEEHGDSGPIEEQNSDNYADTEDGDGRDMVGRIMAQRQMEYSKGGQVANNTTRGWKEGERRDDQSAGQYDDLVLRADDMEDADYTGANSGDELDSEGENERRRDIVSRIMNSRKKKDKLPNPR
jgi:hypothetical protein